MLRREVHLENEDTEENVANIDEKEVETTKIMKKLQMKK